MLAFAMVLLCGLGSEALAQQAPASSPAESAVPTLPAARPISQAAIPSAGGSRSFKGSIERAFIELHCLYRSARVIAPTGYR